METKTKLFIFCSLMIVATIGVIVVSVEPPTDPIKLTQSQVDAMVHSGVIQIDLNVEHMGTSENTGLIYETSKGQCQLYHHPLKGYYCKW